MTTILTMTQDPAPSGSTTLALDSQVRCSAWAIGDVAASPNAATAFILGLDHDLSCGSVLDQATDPQTHLELIARDLGPADTVASGLALRPLIRQEALLVGRSGHACATAVPIEISVCGQLRTAERQRRTSKLHMLPGCARMRSNKGQRTAVKVLGDLQS